MQELDIFKPASPSKFCIYVKFYETKIRFIQKWIELFKEILDKQICTIYVWIESQLDYKKINYNLPFIEKINYITHFNKIDYCKNIIEIENKINYFMSNVGITFQNNHCHAHLKSFIFPKEEYIIHIDGDDMFYNKLCINDLQNLYNYVCLNNIEILFRPYWITVNRGWSFGFGIQKKQLINKMFIFNPTELDSSFKGNNYRNKNIDAAKAMNLDNFFGLILINYYKLPYENLFFYFKSFPYWCDSINDDQKYINNITTENFCKKYNIIEI
jgi:hypothetical protein